MGWSSGWSCSFKKGKKINNSKKELREKGKVVSFHGVSLFSKNSFYFSLPSHNLLFLLYTFFVLPSLAHAKVKSVFTKYTTVKSAKLLTCVWSKYLLYIFICISNAFVIARVCNYLDFAFLVSWRVWPKILKKCMCIIKFTSLILNGNKEKPS